MTDLPYALGCPSCPDYFETSGEDPDANMSEIYEHIFSKHAGYSQPMTYELLAKARELTEAEVAPQ